MHNDNDTVDPHAVRMQREANRWSANRGRGPISLIVTDFEYSYDRAGHGGYLARDGEGAMRKVRWPFHHIVAGCWARLSFLEQTPTPVVSDVTLMADPAGEQRIVEALFATLNADPATKLVTWGGEAKDLLVLRRTAATAGLRMPAQLRDLRPWAPTRIDLGEATSGRSKFVHLPEFCAAVGVPCKPTASKAIGKAVEAGDTKIIEEQVAADVLTTSLLAVRHIIATGLADCDRFASEREVAEAMAAALPDSGWLATVARGYRSTADLRKAAA